MIDCISGTKKYLLKENDSNKAKKHFFRLWVLAKIFNFLWYLGLFWLIFIKIEVVSLVFDNYNDMIWQTGVNWIN